MEAGVKQEARAARLSRPCPPNHKRLRVPGHPGLLLGQLPLIRHLMPVPPVCTRRAPVLTPQAHPARSGLDTPPAPAVGSRGSKGPQGWLDRTPWTVVVHPGATGGCS